MITNKGEINLEMLNTSIKRCKKIIFNKNWNRYTSGKNMKFFKFGGDLNTQDEFNQYENIIPAMYEIPYAGW